MRDSPRLALVRRVVVIGAAFGAISASTLLALRAPTGMARTALAAAIPVAKTTASANIVEPP